MNSRMHNFSDCLAVDTIRLENSTSDDKTFSISLSVPGKVILFGEHSVVYGKLAIAASLGLQTKLVFTEHGLTEIGNNNIHINLYSINLMHCYDTNDIYTNLLKKTNPAILKNITLDKPDTTNHEHFREIIDEFIKKNSGSVPLSNVQHTALFSLFYLLITMIGSSNIRLTPFNLDIETDVTISAGLGSSASLMVSIAAAFYQYVRFKTIRKEKRGNTLKDLSKKDLDLISGWAFSAEKIIHGTPSGLDNTICTFGSMVEYRKNAALKLIELHHKLKVLLIDTKVPKDTKAMVARVAGLKQNYPTVVDDILSAMENISSIAAQELLKLDETCTSTILSVEECKRKVDEIYKRLEDLVDFNQSLLKSLQVSHPSLDKICTVLVDNGLHGKLTGGGGGGYAFTIIPPNFNQSDLERVIDKLTGLGFDTVLTHLGGPGLTFT